MKTDLKKNGPEPRLVTGMPQSKNKVVVAMALVTLMGLLWVRVLFRDEDSPGAAAGPAVAAAGAAEESKIVQLRYMDLDVEIGRHDVLARDVFDIRTTSLGLFPDAPETPVLTPVREDPAFRARAALNGLVLDAILVDSRGVAGEALLDGELAAVGSIIKRKHGDETFEFTVRQIGSDRVVLQWKNESYTVTMPETHTAG